MIRYSLTCGCGLVTTVRTLTKPVRCKVCNWELIYNYDKNVLFISSHTTLWVLTDVESSDRFAALVQEKE